MKKISLVCIAALACVLISGCLDEGGDRVIGTWEWSDGKNYTERYTFNEDHTFSAEALGSTFTGTWEEESPGHYLVTYCNDVDPGCAEPLIETVLYDETTDAIYFPAHYRTG
ncbi:hypothetical protein J2741_001543 [Methanolinea mesophila]|uniref:hypothetical protein n=1 Tax=Methanolinea mesophila TaxID=547055 RepID=UPI001AE19A02|nr:hypothetical protein [Methanolinea mesophila]MBP1928996.1 hypothetical protein [Methanolinea mesophila]